MKLKELEDYNWFPPLLRKYQMELIGILVSKIGLYKHVATKLKKELIFHKINKILDLCSGSGYPAVYLHDTLDMKILQTTLTDKYPQEINASTNVSYLEEPYDVNDLDPNPDTFYTMFNAFHHLDSIEQKNLIQKIMHKKSHLIIVEILQPTLLNIMFVTLASTLGVLLFCPLIRPFEWKRFIFTYLIPINVLTVLIDGYISVLKSKTKNNYQDELSKLFDNSSYIQVTSQFRFPVSLITIKISPEND